MQKPNLNAPFPRCGHPLASVPPGGEGALLRTGLMATLHPFEGRVRAESVYSCLHAWNEALSGLRYMIGDKLPRVEP